MTTIEELKLWLSSLENRWANANACVVLEQSIKEIEALQKENADLRKQLAELTVKKTQVYNPPKPSIGNFSS